MKKNKTFRVGALGAVLVAGLALSGCSSNGHAEDESFSFSGDTLNVVHNNSYMPVSVSDGADEGEVTVEVSTQTLGQKPETPAWSLDDGILNLSTPCGGSVVGYCEASYSIQVPDGVDVLVNGQPVAVD
jgi:hypothetical protein